MHTVLHTEVLTTGCGHYLVKVNSLCFTMTMLQKSISFFRYDYMSDLGRKSGMEIKD